MQTSERDATDLHLAEGERPLLRIRTELRPLDAEPIGRAALRKLVETLVSPAQLDQLEGRKAADLALSHTGHRFRIHIFFATERLTIAIRRLEPRIRGYEQLGLPEPVARLTEVEDGLLLVVGPTGSGKTTTLAALLDSINRTMARHILTIEEPIEYVIEPHRSLIRQRELYKDVHSYDQAVREALRADPDVILVGEMRDRETMRAVLAAAETGHLVFSTLHSSDAVVAIERFIGAFDRGEQDGVRVQLSLVLRAVVAQRLLRGVDRLWPLVEVLRVTPAAANLIRAGKPKQIRQVMESSAALGMQTFEQARKIGIAQGRFRVPHAFPPARAWEGRS